MGGVAASPLIPAAQSQSSSPIHVTPAAVPPLSPAHWIEHGLIDAGGTHEPLIFIRRRGGELRPAAQRELSQESEALIRRLSSQGVEVFHTHLYKGFGLAAEREEMEQTRRAAEIVHRLGMRIDTYVQWNSLMYETFFSEEPRAREWVEMDPNGRPLLLDYGFEQSYRYRICFARREYLDYLKRVVRYAVVEVKTDFIHFDNFQLNREPDSCHNPACVAAFRAYLRLKYTPARRKERFGFEGVEHILPPLWNVWNPPGQLAVVSDPVFQEWVNYRCQLLADALREIATYAKSLNPEVVIEINPQGLTGANLAWDGGVDHARLLPLTQAFWTEQGEQTPGMTRDGRFISKIRSYKLARAYGNILLTYVNDPKAEPLLKAEALAFGQTIGFAGTDPLPPAALEAVAFYRRYREFFVGSEDLAPVALLRSYASIAYHQRACQLSALLLEQTLIQSRIPFTLIFDEQLEHLHRYKVLILPNSECLSDRQLALIRKFVAAGGGVVATEQTGLYDEWRRLREVPGLHDWFPAQTAGRGWPEREQLNRHRRMAPPIARTWGRGRLVYFPRLEFDGPFPPLQQYFSMGPAFWKAPHGWRRIAREIRWAHKSPLPIEISGPDFLAANFVTQAQPRRLMAHLVNYGLARTPQLSNIVLRCRWPGPGLANAQVTLYMPGEEPRPLAARWQGGKMVCRIPELRAYAMAVIHW